MLLGCFPSSYQITLQHLCIFTYYTCQFIYVYICSYIHVCMYARMKYFDHITDMKVYHAMSECADCWHVNGMDLGNDGAAYKYLPGGATVSTHTARMLGCCSGT